MTKDNKTYSIAHLQSLLDILNTKEVAIVRYEVHTTPNTVYAQRDYSMELLRTGYTDINITMTIYQSQTDTGTKNEK